MTVQEIAAHLRDLADKEGLTITIEVSEGGKRIVARAEHGGATFHMEKTSNGAFLIGRPFSTEDGLQIQVANVPRASREEARAIAEAETFMRRFGRG